MNRGRFGGFGGQFVPETLIPILEELDNEYCKVKNKEEFQNELNYYLEEYAGRPTPLYFAENLSKKLGNKIYLKREDLLHTGAHKINNAIGQALLAKFLGKKRIIAETGAGQHGVATATVAALFGLECEVYMGAEDAERQKLNVYRMKLLGTKVKVVNSGSKTLKDAINEALRDYVGNCEDSHYLVGSVVGPHPYPTIVRDFQSVIGKEAKKQILEKEKGLPDYLIACVGGGSNAIGLFHEFLQDEEVKMIGVEAGGKGLKSGKHASRLVKDSGASKGILHGMLTYLLQDENGQIIPTHSISAGLDYPGVGPEHSELHSKKRVEYVSIVDEKALKGFHLLSKLEGIIPALESAHAIAYCEELSKTIKDKMIIINLSGRGDKDVQHIGEYAGEKL